MNRTASHGVLILALLPWTAIGCNQPIAPEYRQQAGSGPDFPQALPNPNAFAGKTVIWGGHVVTLESRGVGSDLIVLQTPLDNNQEPRSTTLSTGQFIARNPSPLDPTLYTTGSKVTVAGTLIGSETRTFGDLQRTYPLIEIKQIHLWGKPYHPEPYVYSPGYTYEYFYWPYAYLPYDYAPHYGDYFGEHYFSSYGLNLRFRIGDHDDWVKGSWRGGGHRPGHGRLPGRHR